MADQLDSDPNMAQAEAQAEKASEPAAASSKQKPQAEQTVEMATEDIDKKLMR